MDLPRTPSFRLDGKRALVTGGTRGIGLGAAAALAEAGARVTVLARRGAEVSDVAGSLGGEGIAGDVTDIAAMRAMIADREPFDVLVNSAGLARHAPFLDVTAEQYDEVLAVNLRAVLFLSQAVAGQLVERRKPGSIIHVSSQMGRVSGPDRGVYSASKFALEGLTRNMAIELGPHNIRVNSICPTFIETELSAKSLANPDFKQWVLGKIKLGRLGRIEDIMGPVVFLASDASALMTGSSLMVDGGWTAE